MSTDPLVQRALKLLAQQPKARSKEAFKQQNVLDQTPVVLTGSLVTWSRADGSVQTGIVDLIHVDDTGTRWAFVTLIDGGWIAVNLKFVREVNP